MLYASNYSGNTVTAYNAATGATVTTGFTSPTGLNGPVGLAVLGNRLLVTTNGSTTVGAYGIPDVATLNNTPTSSNASFITGLNGPAFLAVVPEPSTWAFVAAGAGLLGLTLRRSRRARLG